MADFPGAEIVLVDNVDNHGDALLEVKAVALIPPYAPPYRPGQVWRQPNHNIQAGIHGEGQVIVSWWPLPFGTVIVEVTEDVTVVGAAGALRRLVGYKHNPATGLPGALLFDAGTYDATVLGFRTVVTTGSPTVDNYCGVWLGGITQGAASTRPTIRTLTVAQPGVGLAAAANMNTVWAGWQSTATTFTGAAPNPFPAMAIAGVVPSQLVET
jgi:hypothetical protein